MSVRSSSSADGSPAPAAGGRKHRLFGLTLATDFAFASGLEPASGRPDLVFTLSESAPVAARLGEPVFTSPFKDEAGESVALLYRLAEAELLRFDGAVDFYLMADAIHCHLRDPACRYLVELRLLGPVLAYWLERQGICALHAAAVAVEGRAIAFMAANHGGKTGLAAALMAAGVPLLSDDLLPIERRDGRLFAHPGYPQMRMWPDEVEHFPVRRRTLARVHPRLDKLRVPVGEGAFGAFHSDALPLACLYVPERTAAEGPASEIRIAPLSPRRALIELVRCSFSPFLVEAAGLQPGRLDLLAGLARSVPVRRLVYPSGFEHLPEVRRAVLADCAWR